MNKMGYANVDNSREHKRLVLRHLEAASNENALVLDLRALLKDLPKVYSNAINIDLEGVSLLRG